MAKMFYDYVDRSVSNYIEVSDWVRFNPKPSWWKSLSPLLGGLTSKDEYIKLAWRRMLDGEHVGSPRTVKTCPGIGQFFKQSLPLVFMNDIFLETFADGSFKWRSYYNGVSVAEHSPDQITGSQISRDLITLKFQFPITWLTDKPIQVCFADPVYHNVMPYTIAPGILAKTNTNINYLNVIVFFPKKAAQFVFYKNEVCAVLQSSEPITKLIKKDHLAIENKFQYNLSASIFATKGKDRN